MNRLSKFFLGVLLLTVASASWAACPEGYKSNYKGECVPIPGAVIKTAEGVVSIDPNFILKEEGQGLISERIKNSASHNKPYGYQVVTAPFPVRDGQYAERFEVQPGDCGAAHGWSDCDTSRERWEIYETRNKPGKGDINSKGKMWYTFSIFFPDDYPIVAPVAVTHVQWKENPQGKGEADPNLFHFRFTGDERALRLTVQPEVSTGVDSSLECRTPEQSKTKQICKDLAGREIFVILEEDLRSKWHDFTVFVHWTTDPEKGYFKVCLNGVLAAEWYGRTHLYENSQSMNNLRYGIYRSYLYQYRELYDVEDVPGQVVYFDRVAKYKGDAPEDVKACLSKVSIILDVNIGDVERESDALMRHIEVQLPNYGAVNFGLDVGFWDGGTEVNPNHVALAFNHHTLPSIDIPKMKQCGGSNWFAREKKGKRKIILPFLFYQQSVAPCLYNALDENDQKIVKAVIDQIQEIIDQGVKG